MIKGRHVLFGLLAAFGVVLVVNGVFVYFAMNTFPGNETDNPYTRGLAYNETLEADAAQRAAGWKARVETEAEGIVIEVQNTVSGLVGGLALSGELRRPGQPTLDRHLRFDEVSSGRYLARIDLAPGRWDLTASASVSGAELFKLRRELEIEER